MSGAVEKLGCFVTCSCGYERECFSAWAATATAKLHVVHLGDKAVKHVVTVKKPPHDSQPGEQLQLPRSQSRIESPHGPDR